MAGEEPVALFAATFLVGTGIAVTQSQLPAIVKGRFPERAALVTGIYTLGINAGAAVAAEATPPLDQLLDGFWPGAWPLGRDGSGFLVAGRFREPHHVTVRRRYGRERIFALA